MNKTLLGLCALAALGLSATAMAATAISNMHVTVNSDATCNIEANPLTFSGYNAITQQDAYASTSFTVTCSPGANATQTTVGDGDHSDLTGTTDRAALDNSGSWAVYQLYRDSGRTDEITLAHKGLNTITTNVSAGTSQVFTIYGVTNASVSGWGTPTNATDDVLLTLNYT